MTSLDSRAVSWWPVHQYLAAAVAQAEHLPTAGTPAWCALDDADPLKLLSLAVEAEHLILHREMRQEAHAEASKAVAAAVDWAAIANEIRQLDAARRDGARIERTHVA